MTRDTALVELVSPDGDPVGATTVEHAHNSPGKLHRAYSVLLFDEAGRTLLQQRAATKSRFALRWANACCGHPAPGADVATAAGRRLQEELGLGSVALSAAGVYAYRASDPATGRVEHEYDHILTASIPASTVLMLDPTEVLRVRWCHVDDLRADLAENPARYAPWLAGVMSVWRPSFAATG
jgi:isopentenyl-diphosphate Delta-isomerase